MSTTRKSIVFLALTFLFSWGAAIGLWAMGAANSPGGQLGALTLMMFGPAFAALICTFVFEKDHRREALGVKWTPNWWWVGAWAAALAIGAVSVVASVLLGGRSFTDPGAQTIAMVAAQGGDVAQMRTMPYLGLILIAASVVPGPLINALILTFSEELGWRGYLHSLWRPAGFWRASLATGAIWGFWHAPAILLYGLNYPENREIGVAIFVVFCTMLAPLMTLIRDKGRSVIAPGIAHGTFNALGGVTILAVSNPVFPWSGIVGIGGFVALAIMLALIALFRARKQHGAVTPAGAAA